MPYHQYKYTKRLVAILSTLVSLSLAQDLNLDAELISQLAPDEEFYINAGDGVEELDGTHIVDESLETYTFVRYMYFWFGQELTIRGGMLLTYNDATTPTDGVTLTFRRTSNDDWNTCTHDFTSAGYNDNLVDGVGSVFNCNWKYVDRGAISCSGSTCTPGFNIRMLRIWSKTAISAGATAYLWSDAVIQSPYGLEHLDQVIGHGICCDNTLDLLTIDKMTGPYAAINLQLREPAEVYELHWMANSDVTNLYLNVYDGVKDWVDFYPYSTDTPGCVHGLPHSTNDYTVFLCKDGGTSYSQYHTGLYVTILIESTYQALQISKLVLIGQFCDEVNMSYDEDAWDAYIATICIDFTYYGQVIQLDVPDYTHGCIADYPDYWPDFVWGYNVDFFDYTRFSQAADWITFTGTKFIIEPEERHFTYYETENNNYVLISPRAVPTYNSNQQTGYGPSFNVFFTHEDSGRTGPCTEGQEVPVMSLEEQCEYNTLIPPTVEILIETGIGLDDVIYEFPEVQDRASLNNGDTTGLILCGERAYAVVGGEDFLSIGSNERDLVLQTNNPVQSGPHQPKVRISLKDYPNVILEHEIEVYISTCDIESIQDPTETIVSAYNVLVGMPVELEIDAPQFEPYPLCGQSADDVTYEVQEANGGDPGDWVEFDSNSHTIVIQANSESLLNIIVSLKLVATFQTYTEEQFFKVVFNKAEEEEEEETEEVEEQQLPTESLQDAASTSSNSTNSTTTNQQQTEAIGWDGWKILMEQMNLGFSLPERNTDPDFVPIPPKVSISSISVKGVVKISFSKPIFTFDRLKQRRIAEGRRDLQEQEDGGGDSEEESDEQEDKAVEVEVEEEEEEFVNGTGRRFLQIDIVPGENSDPSFLSLDYNAEFIDSQLILVQLLFDQAPAISANQPEEVLKLSFNGPFFDQVDGLPLDVDNMVITANVPPQVALGILTDTIEAGGDVMQSASATFLAGNSIINILIAGSLAEVWGMINNLQLIIFAPLVNVQFPGNAFMLYDVMIVIGTFDYLDTDDIFPNFVPSIEESEPYSPKFDRLDISHAYLVMNLGSLFIVFLINILMYLIYIPIKYVGADSRCTKVFEKKIQKKMFWNTTIIFLQEAYIDLLFCIVINISNFEDGWSTWEEKFTNVCSIFLGILVVFLPLFIICYIWPNYNNLKTKYFKQKYGAIYETIYIGKKKKKDKKKKQLAEAAVIQIEADRKKEKEEVLTNRTRIALRNFYSLQYLGLNNNFKHFKWYNILNKEEKKQFKKLIKQAAQIKDENRLPQEPEPEKEEVEEDKKENHWKMLWVLMFFVRRILFAAGVLFLIQYPFFQITLFIFPTLACLVIIGQFEPLKSPWLNNLELYNQFTIIILAYCLMLFTDFVPDPITRYNVGFAMIFLTVQNIIFNLTIIARTPIRQIILRLKRCCARRNSKKSFTRKLTRSLSKKGIQKKLKKMKTKIMLESSSSSSSSSSEKSVDLSEEEAKQDRIRLYKVKQQEESKAVFPSKSKTNRWFPAKVEEKKETRKAKETPRSHEKFKQTPQDAIRNLRAAKILLNRGNESSLDLDETSQASNRFNRHNDSQRDGKKNTYAAGQMHKTQYDMKKPSIFAIDDGKHAAFPAWTKSRGHAHSESSLNSEDSDDYHIRNVDNYRKFCMGNDDQDIVLGAGKQRGGKQDQTHESRLRKLQKQQDKSRKERDTFFGKNGSIKSIGSIGSIGKSGNIEDELEQAKQQMHAEVENEYNQLARKLKRIEKEQERHSIPEPHENRDATLLNGNSVKNAQKKSTRHHRKSQEEDEERHFSDWQEQNDNRRHKQRQKAKKNLIYSSHEEEKQQQPQDFRNQRKVVKQSNQHQHSQDDSDEETQAQMQNRKQENATQRILDSSSGESEVQVQPRGRRSDRNHQRNKEHSKTMRSYRQSQESNSPHRNRQGNRREKHEDPFESKVERRRKRVMIQQKTFDYKHTDEPQERQVHNELMAHTIGRIQQIINE